MPSHSMRRFGIPAKVKAELRRRRRLPALWYVGPLEQEVPNTVTDPALLIAVTAIITRANGTVERVPLDVEAYRDGRFEPAPTLANGESLTIVADYA